MFLFLHINLTNKRDIHGFVPNETKSIFIWRYQPQYLREYVTGAKTCQIWRYGARVQLEIRPGGQRTWTFF